MLASSHLMRRHRNLISYKRSNPFTERLGIIVEGVAVTVGTDRKSIKVNAPANGYESASDYTIYIKGAVSSTTGKQLANTKMSFTTK